MKKYIIKILHLVFILNILYYSAAGTNGSGYSKLYNYENIESMYNNLQPSDIKPSYKVFYAGIKGYWSIQREGLLQNHRFLTIIDYSLSSKQRRLWVIDLDSLKIVYNTLVAHGKNTGGEYAVSFSNIPRSYMSSLGFFLTGSTYVSKHGLSLYLDGLEAGINDNVRKRTIVMHSADYATRNFIQKYGWLGRSFGCPVLPPLKSEAVIETIKNKSCLYIYYPDKNYFTKSRYINLI